MDCDIKNTFLYFWNCLTACVFSISSKVCHCILWIYSWLWSGQSLQKSVVVNNSAYSKSSVKLSNCTAAAVRHRQSVLGYRCRFQMAESGGGLYTRDDATSSLMTQQKEFHKLAFDFLSQALEIDETTSDVTQKINALELYRKGIKELENGVNIVVRGQGEEVERAQRLHDKMARSLQQTIERVEVLEEQMRTSSVDVSYVPARTPFSHTKIPESLSSAHGVKRKPDSAKSSFGLPSVGVSQPGYIHKQQYRQPLKSSTAASPRNVSQKPGSVPKRPLSATQLKNVDSKLANIILNEIFDAGTGVTFDDVAGQQTAKQALQEIVILPSLRPELFTGLRAPARGLLLFGPPGNGKTMLAKAVAQESSAKFFCISAASLTSKWVGEGEKLVRALFAVAKELQPSIIFIDEVDSLLCERRESEQDASRRIKTQFLLEFDGIHSNADDRVLVMGTTNRPFELDDAVLRRFPKRVYVQMPDFDARVALLEKLLSKHGHPLSHREIEQISRETEGYSSSDLTALAKDAALGPIRDLDPNLVKSVDVNKVRKITVHDFVDSLRRIRCSVPAELLQKLTYWNRQFGDISS